SLGHITDPGCGTALHRGGLEAIGWAGVAHPITALGEVANLGCRAAHSRALGIGRTGGTGTRARLRRVTRTGRSTAHRTRIARWMLAGITRAIALVKGTGVAITGTCRTAGRLSVSRAVGARPVATLGHIAVSRRRTADRARVARRMGACRTAA